MTSPPVRTSLREQSTYLFIGQTLSYLIQVFTPFFLVRLISRDDYGVYLQFILITETLIPILNLTLPSSLFFFLPTATPEDQRQYIWQTIGLSAIVGILFVAIFGSFARTLLPMGGFALLGGSSVFLMMYLVFMLISNIGDFIFIIEKRKTFNLVYYPADRLIRLILMIVMVMITGGFRGCIIALFLYSTLRLIFILTYLYRGYLSRLRSFFDKRKLMAQLSYTLPFAGAIIIKTMAERLDKYMVNLFITPGQYAIYGVAFLSIPLLQQVYTAVNNVAMPEITLLAASRNIQGLKALWHKIIEKNASITIPCVVFFVLMARETIFFLFTEKYIAAVPYYRIYLLTFLFVMTGYGMILRAANRTRQIFRANMIGSILTLAIGILIIRRWLLWGAMMTAVCGIVLPVFTQLIYEKRFLGLKLTGWFPWGRLFRILLSALPSIILIIVMKSIIQRPLPRLLAGAALFFPLVAIIQINWNVFIYPEIIPLAKRMLVRLSGKHGQGGPPCADDVS